MRRVDLAVARPRTTGGRTSVVVLVRTRHPPLRRHRRRYRCRHPRRLVLRTRRACLASILAAAAASWPAAGSQPSPWSHRRRRSLAGQVHDLVHDLVGDRSPTRTGRPQSLRSEKSRRLAEPDVWPGVYLPKILPGGATTLVPITATGIREPWLRGPSSRRRCGRGRGCRRGAKCLRGRCRTVRQWTGC